MPNTRNPTYTQSLVKKQTAWWKRLLHVQAPYRWNLQRLRLGYTLEIGCGIGRNLVHLRGRAVGIDHNAASVEVARSRHLAAFTPQEFLHSPMNRPSLFDSLLVAHVLEHMPMGAAVALLRTYLPHLRQGGRVIMITPQEAGYRSDVTHVEFKDFAALREIGRQLGIQVIREYSFPFPRWAGSHFAYNEFVCVGQHGADKGSDGA